jgi:hypothetical protein
MTGWIVAAIGAILVAVNIRHGKVGKGESWKFQRAEHLGNDWEGKAKQGGGSGKNGVHLLQNTALVWAETQKHPGWVTGKALMVPQSGHVHTESGLSQRTSHQNLPNKVTTAAGKSSESVTSALAAVPHGLGTVWPASGKQQRNQQFKFEARVFYGQGGFFSLPLPSLFWGFFRGKPQNREGEFRSSLLLARCAGESSEQPALGMMR